MLLRSLLPLHRFSSAFMLHITTVGTDPGQNWSRTQAGGQTGPALLSPAGGPVSPAEPCRWTRWALAHSIHSHGVSSSIGPHVTFDPGTLTGSSENQKNKGVCAARPADTRFRPSDGTVQQQTNTIVLLLYHTTTESTDPILDYTSTDNTSIIHNHRWHC